MEKIFKMIVIVLAIWFMTVPASAEELVLGVGLSLPPYFIQDSDSGIELDIIRESLKMNGYTIKTRYLPFARVPIEMSRGRIDCAATVNEASGIKAFYSKSHIFYQNVVVALKSSQLKITSVNDLKSKKVVAFQNATKYLGSEFAGIAAENSKYQEVADQETQNKLLFKKRTDVVVGDINIFKFFTRKVAGIVDTSQPVVYNNIFPKTYYKVGFVKEKHRDDFDKGLAVIKANGVYKKILKKYVD